MRSRCLCVFNCIFTSHTNLLQCGALNAGGRRRLTGQTHTFARDLRTYTALLEAVEECKKAGKWSKVGSRLKGMIGTLTERAGDTKKSVRSRLKDVQEVLDK